MSRVTVQNSLKFEHFPGVFKLLLWRQKWIARVRQLALRSLLPGRKIVVSFITEKEIENMYRVSIEL